MNACNINEINNENKLLVRTLNYIALEVFIIFFLKN